MFLHAIREAFWNYPEFFVQLRGGLRQLLYLAIAIIIAVGAVWSIQTAPPQIQGLLLSNRPNEYHEGVIGTVNSLNPISISNNSAEEDIKNLLFNRLVHIAPSGEVLPDLAETWNITDDGKIYTFFLQDNLRWHDGEPLTADDVVFTYEILKNREELGTLGQELAKVTITKLDSRTVRFVLPSRNALFMELINIFIAPQHLLQNKTYPEILFSDFSQQPIGSGDYELVHFRSNEIKLKYVGNKFREQTSLPAIRAITFNIYDDEQSALLALKSGAIMGVANVSGAGVQSLASYHNVSATGSVLTNHTRLVFLNTQNGTVLQSKGLRQAVSSAINRQQIVDLVSGAQVATGPIPYDSWAFDPNVKSFTYDPELAKKMLEDQGWKYPADKTNPLYRQYKDKELAISFTFLNTPLNSQVANVIAQNLLAVGIKVILQPEDFTTLTEQTIPERSFEMLLFEVQSNIDPDRYALWHSNNIKYPGLNITGYKNQRVDILLERARTSINREQRKNDYALFQKYLLDDTPAVYLYHPAYYMVYDNKRLQLPAALTQLFPGSRFDRISEWQLR